MRINKLKINGYGNIQNKEIELNNKINLIYGENESGKSTIFKFIINMLYGCAKTKKGQDISDFEKYYPWNSEEFSGQINYELDNKNKFEIFREFKKKNPKIYNENSEDISKEFNVDKTNGINYFYEQTNIDEELFLSSTAIMQNNVKLEEKNQNNLIQKITNIANTGEDNISFKKTIEYLNKKQLEEIGTSRSTDRPINKIEKELNKLKSNKNDLNIFENEKNNLAEKQENIKSKIKELEEEINVIKKIKKINEENKIEKEKIKINEEIILKNNEELEKLNLEKNKYDKKIENNINKNKNAKKVNKTKYEIITLILFFVSIMLHIILKNNLFIISHIIFFTLFLITLFFNNKNNKIKNNQKSEIEKINNEKIEIENKIEIINKNIQEEKVKIDLIKNNYINKINQEKENIKNNTQKINIDNLFLNIENIDNILEEKQNYLNNEKIELHKMKFNEENNYEKIEELILIKEKINSLEEEYEELKQKNKSIEIAKEVIENSYKKMRENITPKFVETLSEIINKISNGKYKKIRFNLEEGLIVQKENGDYISINRLSTGTIDQLYLGFRLSIIKEITNEKIPIILDEAFAFYDEKRLENILKYLNEEVENQIIIFTCTNREKNIFEKNNTDYKFIRI